MFVQCRNTLQPPGCRGLRSHISPPRCSGCRGGPRQRNPLFPPAPPCRPLSPEQRLHLLRPRSGSGRRDAWLKRGVRPRCGRPFSMSLSDNSPSRRWSAGQPSSLPVVLPQLGPPPTPAPASFPLPPVSPAVSHLSSAVVAGSRFHPRCFSGPSFCFLSLYLSLQVCPFGACSL